MRIFLHVSLWCGVQTAGPFFKFIVVRVRVRVQFFWVGVVRVQGAGAIFMGGCGTGAGCGCVFLGLLWCGCGRVCGTFHDSYVRVQNRTRTRTPKSDIT